jgi:hypothetical protein
MYERQVERVNRFLERIKTPSNDQQEYEDMLWAFFQNCWHLRDWITNDDSAPKELKSAIKSSEKLSKWLLLCADLANGSKHFKRNRDPFLGGEMHSDVTVYVGSTTPKADFRYFVTDNAGQEYDAVAVAIEAVREWVRLLKEHT